MSRRLSLAALNQSVPHACKYHVLFKYSTCVVSERHVSTMRTFLVSIFEKPGTCLLPSPTSKQFLQRIKTALAKQRVRQCTNNDRLSLVLPSSRQPPPSSPPPQTVRTFARTTASHSIAIRTISNSFYPRSFSSLAFCSSVRDLAALRALFG